MVTGCGARWGLGGVVGGGGGSKDSDGDRRGGLGRKFWGLALG